MDGLLARGVEARRRFVEHQDFRIAHERSGDRDALLLPPRQAHAVLAHDLVEAVRERDDVVVDVGGLRGRLHRGVGRFGVPLPDVLADRGVEEERRLAHDRDALEIGAAGEGLEVLAVDQDRAPGRVVEAEHQVADRGLAAARRADERHRVALRNLEGDVGEDLRVLVVGERHVVEPDRVAQAGERIAALLVVVHVRQVEVLGRALDRRHRVDEVVVLLHDPLDRLVEGGGQHREDEERPDRHLDRPAHDEPSAADHQEHGKEVVEQGDERAGRGLGALHLDCLLGDALVRRAELPRALFFAAERLHDPDAAEGLKQDLVELRALLLAAVRALQRLHRQLADRRQERNRDQEAEREDRREQEQRDDRRPEVERRPHHAERQAQPLGVAADVAQDALDELAAVALVEERDRLGQHLPDDGLADVHQDRELCPHRDERLAVRRGAHDHDHDGEEQHDREQRRVPAFFPIGDPGAFVRVRDPLQRVGVRGLRDELARQLVRPVHDPGDAVEDEAALLLEARDVLLRRLVVGRIAELEDVGEHRQEEDQPARVGRGLDRHEEEREEDGPPVGAGRLPDVLQVASDPRALGLPLARARVLVTRPCHRSRGYLARGRAAGARRPAAADSSAWQGVGRLTRAAPSGIP